MNRLFVAVAGMSVILSLTPPLFQYNAIKSCNSVIWQKKRTFLGITEACYYKGKRNCFSVYVNQPPEISGKSFFFLAVRRK